jgi:hypothetical protein
MTGSITKRYISLKESHHSVMNKKWHQHHVGVRRRTRLLRSTAILLGLLGSTNSQPLRNFEKQLSTNAVWDNLLDVASPERDRQDATPLFWHIHKAGGTTLHDFLSSCLNLTVAAEVGVLSRHQDDQVWDFCAVNRKPVRLGDGS